MPKFLTNLDLTKNELQNIVLHPLATAPSAPVQGQMYYNTGEKKAYIYNGSTWVEITPVPVETIGSLNDISDVSITLATTGDILRWNGTAWVNSTLQNANIAAADHTHLSATTSTAGFMSASDKTKLDGVESGAQVNVATNLAQGTRTTTTVPITSSTGTSATLNSATTSLAGVMSSADKTKLDGIAAGAQVNVATDLSYTAAASNGTVNSSTGTNATIPAATTSLSGLLTSADKTKLDGIAANANNYTLPAATSTVLGGIELFSDTVQTVASNAVQTGTGRTYGLQINSAGQGVINVPWTDTVYTHPTGGANTTITAANGSVLSAITVNNLGHVTSVASKTLAAVDLPSHTHTKSEVGLGNVDNVQQIPLTQKGAANGVAELDAAGKVPANQLPSYVDDVLEYANLAAFPATGETGKIYIAMDTNIVYRWSGTAYVEISSSLALGETSSTAYRGDRGKIAYDHSQIADGSNPHGTTFTNIASKPTTLSGYGITDAATSTHTHGDISNTGTISTTVVAPANGDTILVADSSNSNKVQRAITIGTATTTYLRNDGTWVTPPDTNTTYGAGNGIGLSGTTFSVAAGTGLTQEASGLAHSDTSALTGAQGTAGIASITVDGMGHVTGVTTATYMRRFAQVLSTSAGSYTITHNLNTRDVIVSVRENSGEYAQVFCDVEFTTVNTITLRFATAPTANALSVTVIG